MADDAAARAQAVIDMMNTMDAESGAVPAAQPVAQPKTGGLFNFLAALPILGNWLKPAPQTVPKPAQPAVPKELGGAAGALMRRKMLNEALRGDPTLTDEQLIEMMSPKRR